MLLGGDARQGLEPVGEVRRALLERPLLHGVGDLVGDVEVDVLALVYDAPQLLVGGLGQTLLHVRIGEYQAAVFLGYLVCCHEGFLSLPGVQTTEALSAKGVEYRKR